MKIKCVLLALALLTLCSCEKGKWKQKQLIKQTDCVSIDCSWNGSWIELGGYSSYYETYTWGYFIFISGLTGDLSFDLAWVDKYADSNLAVYSNGRCIVRVVDANWSDLEESYTVAVNKGDTIQFIGRLVKVGNVKITGYDYGDDNDNQGDGWEDDF